MRRRGVTVENQGRHVNASARPTSVKIGPTVDLIKAPKRRESVAKATEIGTEQEKGDNTARYHFLKRDVRKTERAKLPAPGTNNSDHNAGTRESPPSAVMVGSAARM